MLVRPLPVPDVESAPFWEGCKQSRLLIQRCGDHFQFPPTSYCTRCNSRAPQWYEASGRGLVYSWIVVHVPIPREIYGSQVPYITALVDLAEGPRLCTNLIEVSPNDVRAGMLVEVTFQAVGDGTFSLPFFRPVNQ